jgi:Big-like domain-containing protein/nidogen-like/alpha/beta hydrolase family protein DUF900/thrombospondin type 3 repeat protein
MKLVPPDQRRAISAVRLSLALAAMVTVPLLLYAAPAWWSQHNILVQNAAPDDYAPANHGQLKNIARAAADEMDARIPGGAGDEIHELIISWSTPTAQTNDFAPLTVGQLKTVAKIFYNRLIAVKYANDYPWSVAARLPHDFAVATIGQVKGVFHFDFTAIDLEHDSDQDGLPDWWEKSYFGDLTVDPGALAPCGDGLTNIQSFQQGLNPLKRSPQFLSIRPDQIDQTLAAGQVATKIITISNSGMVPRRVSVIAHNGTAIKPSYSDSDQPDGPQFVWDDISTTGIHLDSVSDADDDFEGFPISFAFPYFGDSYSTVYVGSNGFITLGSGANSFINHFLPTPAAPANLIAPFHTDLDLSASGDVYYRDYGDRVVIQFENVARYAGDGFATFQVVLNKDGLIQFYYKDMAGTLDDATVGLQNATGDRGLTIAFNQPYLKQNLAIEITQSAAWFKEVPVDLLLLPGGAASFLVTLDGFGFGTFRGGLTVMTDNPSDAPFDLPVTMTVVDEGTRDDDGDTLTNAQERTLGTNPANPDTDGDGMPDGWEVANNLNPLANDASLDFDGDGFTNLQEYQNSTNPQVYTAPATFVETFDDWSHVNSDSGNWRLDTTSPADFLGDASRAVRTSASTAVLDYWIPQLMAVTATVYYRGSLPSGQIRFYSSADAETWSELKFDRIADWPAGGNWQRTVFSRNASFPSDSFYFRVEVSGGDVAESPQLSQISFVYNDLTAPVANSRDLTTHSGESVSVRLSASDSDGDPVTYRLIEQPAHGSINGTPPDLIYTAASNYIGTDRFYFVASDGTRDSTPAGIFINVKTRPPSVPTNLEFTEVSLTSAELTWTSQSATAYLIERSTDGGLTWQQIGEVTGASTSFVDSSYRSGTFYSYRVRAKGETGSVSDASGQISSKGTNPTTTDSDGDGVLDNLEAQRHSNPDSKDSDGDGVPDDKDGAPSDPSRWAKAIERQYAVVDLGTLPRSPGTSPLAINNRGHVLCAADPYGRYFLWQNGRRTALPGNFTPYGLSDSDTIVGDTTYFYSPLSRIVTNGAYWNNGQLMRLPQLTVGYPGYPKFPTYTSSAAAINNRDEIAGWSSADGSSLFATKWVAGGAGIALDAPISFKIWPFAISDSGAVLATAQTDSGYDVDLLPATRLVSSRDVGGASNGYRINSSGVIVSRGRQIWLQGEAGGASHDVNSLLAPESATTVDFSYGITNQNEILADAHDETGDHYLSIVRLARDNSPTIVYKVVESDPRIDYIWPADMNDNGLIAGTAAYNDGTPDHAILLVPAELMVDGNRDNALSFTDQALHDADRTSEEKPYRFWVNDDQDAVSGTNQSEEVTPAQIHDNQDEKIQSLRDCEDLARLWLNIAGLTEGFKTGEIQLVLRFRNVKSGNPAIRVFRAVENGGRGYLSDTAWGTLQSSPPYDQALPGTNGPGIASSTSGIYIDRRFWGGLDESDPVINLLFEGVAEGLGELYFDIIKDGQRIGVSPGVWLDIKTVEKMYERAKITLDAPNIPAPWNNRQAPLLQWAWDSSNGVSVDSNATAQTIVYVHGWRMTYNEYLSWANTTFKRLFHVGYKGRFFSFHWPTFNGENNGPDPVDLFVPGGATYNPSEYRAWLSGPALANFVNSLPNPNARYLLAHSMGNVVAGAALRSGMIVTRYAMCNSAMAAMAYDGTLTPDDSEYQTPDTDPDVGTRQIFGLANRFNPAGTEIVNFSLPNDYALSQWSENNKLFKPQVFTDGTHYFYASQGTVGHKLGYVPLTHDIQYVTSQPEAMAYVTKSRTRAAGARQDTGGAVVSFVNMGLGGFEFGDEHSAEWVYTTHKTYLFWKEVLKKFDLDVSDR